MARVNASKFRSCTEILTEARAVALDRLVCEGERATAEKHDRVSDVSESMARGWAAMIGARLKVEGGDARIDATRRAKLEIGKCGSG